MSIGQASAGVL